MKFIKSNKEIIKWITLLIMTNLLSIYLFTSGLISLPNTLVLKNDSPEFLSELEKMNAIDNLINKNYLNEIDNLALGETLVQDMINYLDDPYSEYYSGQEFAELIDSYKGSFGGIGVVIDGSDPNNILITEVLDDTPAKEAGIETNDIIVKVDGEDVTGKGANAVVEKTRGEVGTTVDLTVLRNGEEKTFTITRKDIDSSTVTGTMIDNLGYISINSFNSKTDEQFEKETNKLIEQGATGLIIDLRNNGGGTVDSAVNIADQLLGEDQIAYSVSKDKNRQYFTSDDKKIDIPFVVLVNENTASASELLSGSLQKSGITIIGQKTFGKGVIQSFARLKDGSGVKLTVQEYFLKDDSPVNQIGITPNLVVDNTVDPEQQIFVDNQLNSAIEFLHNK